MQRFLRGSRVLPLEHSFPSYSRTKALLEFGNPPARQPESWVWVRELKSGFFSLPQRRVCPDQSFQFGVEWGEKEARQRRGVQGKA